MRRSTAVTFVARGEQDVPYEWIDGAAGNDADSIQVLIHGGNMRQVDEHEQNDGRMSQLFDHRLRRGHCCNLIISEVRRVDGVPW